MAIVDDERGATLRQRFGLLTQQDLCRLLGVTQETIETWRRDRTGPVFTRLGKAVYYRETDVTEWINSSVGNMRVHQHKIEIKKDTP